MLMGFFHPQHAGEGEYFSKRYVITYYCYDIIIIIYHNINYYGISVYLQLNSLYNFFFFVTYSISQSNNNMCTYLHNMIYCNKLYCKTT